MKIGKIAKPKELDVETVKDSNKYKNWKIGLKYDGTRQFLVNKGNNTELYNKRGTDKTRHFPDITDEVALPKGTVLDGETITKDKLHPHGNKQTLQSRDGGTPVVRKSSKLNFKEKMKMKQYPATFVAFDILEYKGENVRDMPLQERRKLLEDVVNGLGKEVEISKKYDDFNKAWNEVTENKMEGVILKKPESEYPEGRTSAWRKVKNISDTILTVEDYEEHSKGITAITEKEDRVTVNGSQSQKVKKLVDKNGSVEAEISYLEKTKNDNLREPRWKRLKNE